MEKIDILQTLRQPLQCLYTSYPIGGNIADKHSSHYEIKACRNIIRTTEQELIELANEQTRLLLMHLDGTYPNYSYAEFIDWDFGNKLVRKNILYQMHQVEFTKLHLVDGEFVFTYSTGPIVNTKRTFSPVIKMGHCHQTSTCSQYNDFLITGQCCMSREFRIVT